MIISLFSLFDPSCRIFNLSWLVLLLCIFIFPSFIWTASSVNSIFYTLVSFVKLEIFYSMPKSYKGSSSLLRSVFLLIFSLNFISLFPHNFSSTSHLTVSFPLAFRLWLGVIFFSLYSSFYRFLAHLAPLGTPLVLLSFIVVVETLRNFIRPVALTFRLTANIMAGHLILSLVGSGILSLSFSSLLACSLVQIILVCIELGVALIQAYVFTTLILLYLSESSH